MGIFKRALRSITRRKGKTIILLLIVFILGNVIAASVSIKQSTTSLEEQIKKQMGATSTITMNFKLIEEDMNSGVLNETNMPQYGDLAPKVDAIKSIGGLPQVNYYDYTLSTILEGKTLKSIQQDNVFNTANNFTIHGYAREEIDEVKENKIKMVSGKLPTQEQITSGEHVALMSKKVAETNAINVGDEVILLNKIIDSSVRADESGESTPAAQRELAVTIVGIFEVQAGENKSSGNDFSNWKNNEMMNSIYMPISLVESEVTWQNEEGAKLSKDTDHVQTPYLEYQTKYVLKDPGELDSFKKDAQAYLHKYMTIHANSDNYEAISQPIKKLSTIANYVLIAGSAVSILILTLIVILFLRDRKHELGILLALGESKIKVFQQIFLEVFAVAIIAMTLALFSGNLLAKQVSGNLMNNNNDTLPPVGYVEYMVGSDMNTDQLIDEYKVVFTPQIVLIYYGVGILTVLLSTAGPMLYILRLEPKKILM